MKTKLTIFALFVICNLGFSQQSINYKAVVKDNLGNVIANAAIEVRFVIFQGAGQTNVYQETHMPITDANGIIILNIGEGTPESGTYADIDWANDDHFLNVQIDSGSGFIDLGTTQFLAVPYAITARSAALKTENGITSNSPGDMSSDDFVFGSTSLDNVNGTSDDRRFFFDKSKGAIRAGQENGTGWDASNVGSYSAGFGFNSEASGIYSFSTGNQTTASGGSSLAFGAFTLASGSNSGAFGLGSTASGYTSFSFGNTTDAIGRYALATGSGTMAESFNATAIGAYNIGGGNETVWITSDPLLEIGNGTDDLNRSNALTILKNGTITAPSFDLTEITDNKALTTKEYVDQNGSSGLETIDEGNGDGWRLKGKNPANYGNIGEEAIDFSLSSQASSTRGATGWRSFAVGLNAIASGSYSITIGSGEASGQGAKAIGLQLDAPSWAEVVVGVRNSTYIPNSTVGYNSTDRLFSVGNGASSTNRSNALTILKNGNIGLTTVTPNAKLHVTNGADASLTNDTGFIVLGDVNGTNLALDSNEIMARNNGTTATLLLQRDGGDVSVGGVLVHSSDRRLKKDITEITYGLKEILQLQPKEYFWKNREQSSKSLGLIAQEVQPIIESIVHQRDDKDRTLSVSYTELIPVLIKALQEQQEIITNQNTKINSLSTKLDAYKSLDQRLESLEKTIEKKQF